MRIRIHNTALKGKENSRLLDEPDTRPAGTFANSVSGASHITVLLHLVDNTLEETGALGAVGEMLEGEAQLVENRPENNNNTQFNLVRVADTNEFNSDLNSEGTFEY